MDEILHVKLGISTKFYLWDIILSHTFNYIHVLNVPSIVIHWGLHLQVIHLFCCNVQTDLSAELALRLQYQCCFHNIIKSANYSITPIHKNFSNLIYSRMFYKCELFSGSVHGE